MRVAEWCKKCGDRRPTMKDGECTECHGYGIEGKKLLREADGHEADSKRAIACAEAAEGLGDFCHAEALKSRAQGLVDKALDKRRKALEIKFEVPEADGW